MVIGRMDVPVIKKKATTSNSTSSNSDSNPKHLPTASTCDKTLRLPEYATSADMLVGLIAAIEYGCIGFDKA